MTSKAKKPRGIVLTDREVRALRGDRLTMLVRQAEVPPTGHNGGALYEVVPSLLIHHGDLFDARYHLDNPRAIRCPFGAPGERRFVREPLKRDVDGCWVYASDDAAVMFDVLSPRAVDMVIWAQRTERPVACAASQMPAWASRDTIEIASVEVRRVQSVTEAEARACGAVEWDGDEPGDYRGGFREAWEARRGADWLNDWAWFVVVRRVAAERSAA